MPVSINGTTGITTPGITNSGNETITGNTAITGTLSVGSNNISPVQSFRNKIINGSFQYWQRGTSTSTAGYLADRWQTNTNGSTFTASRQSFTLGQTAVPDEPTYFHRTVVTSVAGAGNYCLTRQYVESVRTLAGQTATLSFWAKADSAKNIAIDLAQIFGTGGSPSTGVSGIGVTTCALTTSFQKFTIPVTFPSISGKTLGSNNDDYVEVNFWFDAGSSSNARTNSLGQQSGTFDIAQVQLEAGSVATPFEVRPFQTELALCQRYYQLFNVGTSYQNIAGYTYQYFTFSLPVLMRGTATVAVFSQFQYYSSGTGANFTPTFGAVNTSLGTMAFIVYIQNFANLNGLAAGTASLSSEL